MSRKRSIAVFIASILMLCPVGSPAGDNAPNPSRLPDTAPLTFEGDLADKMVAGIDQFLLSKIAEAANERETYWDYDFSSPEAYIQSIKSNRAELVRILGVRDPRIAFDAPRLTGTTERPALIAENDRVRVFAVRWPVLGFPGPNNKPGVAVHGAGLLLLPAGREPIANVVALPDAGQTPEMIAGLVKDVPGGTRYALRLAEQGCRVIVPTLIGRDMKVRGGKANITDREFLYRPGFELGRGLIGYELQKVLAAVDWFETSDGRRPVGVIGYGEGGMLALYAAAIDPRIDVALVSGYFGPRARIWNEPISRNVFGRLTRFGDAELASLIAPRILIVSAAGGPELMLPSEGGAPATLKPVPIDSVKAEVERARELIADLDGKHLFLNDDAPEDAGPVDLDEFLRRLGIEPSPSMPTSTLEPRFALDSQERHARQFQEIKRHTQWLLYESPYIRDEFMSKLDTSSLDAYKKSVERYREIFSERIIGEFDEPLLPPRPRSRQTRRTEHWTEYEVVLDVFPDVIAYGILLIPNDLKPGERRPVVVFQHGLEGRPQDVITGDHRAYRNVGSRLAEKGYVVFAPQAPYLFKDRFRTLQRKSNAIGKTLFSTIIPQHQQIVDWLQSQPFVAGDRIGFYGLSYGGKAAMRIPAVVTDYKLSICSGDYNDWIWKNASTRAKYSYVWHGEYEIFEFDLGMTFNYSDMAALICPRPFMVERGHFDGVAPDYAVGAEFAKVRHLYAAELGIGDRCEIEWFVGPHAINAEETFEFLREQL